jgi:hypothetical protein
LEIKHSIICEDDFYNKKANLQVFETDITDKKSIYNNYENVDMKEIASMLITRHGKLYLYEHYFTWFKNYFQYYLKSIYTLLYENGPLSRPWRFYIAIMAASTMRSSYLLKSLEEYFIQAGGDESWLINGLNVVPEKIVRLGRINNILAHQPWIIKPDDIREINAGKQQKDNSYWNINELMYAILIMIHFHKISIIVESMRFQLKNNESLISKHTNEENDENNLKEKLIKNLEKVISDESEDESQIFISDSDLDLGETKKISWSDSKFAKHINSFCNVYHDFDPHSEEYRSYLVNIHNHRNSIGKIKVTTFSKIYLKKEWNA